MKRCSKEVRYFASISTTAASIKMLQLQLLLIAFATTAPTTTTTTCVPVLLQLSLVADTYDFLSISDNEFIII